MMSIKKAFYICSAAFLFTALLSSCAPYHARHKPVKYEAAGTASWYGPGFAGRKTASGERFKPSALTAAHRTLPFGTSVKVTNLANGRSVVVRINDRGPYCSGRLIDLSHAAAKKIGLLAAGTGEVKIVALNAGTSSEIKEKKIARNKFKKSGDKSEIESVIEDNF
jgi:rare lipoprotein A